jgi:hypothetical protein
LAWVRFLSTTSPTTPRPSIDITWGLIIPWEEGAKSFASYYEHNRTVPGGKVPLIEDGKITYKSQHHLTALLVDVGGPHSFGSTVNLTRAEGVVPGEVPEFLNFVIEFFD